MNELGLLALGLILLLFISAILELITKTPVAPNFQPYSARNGDERFFVDQWNEDSVTVSIDIKGEPAVPFYLDIFTKSSVPDLASDIIEKLKSQGIIALDIGYNSDWIAADYPITDYNSNKDKEIAKMLIELKSLLESS